MAVDGAAGAGKATPHDITVSKTLATVLTGGPNGDVTVVLKEDDILAPRTLELHAARQEPEIAGPDGAYARNRPPAAQLGGLFDDDLYRPLRDMRFVLNEVLNAGQLAALPVMKTRPRISTMR